MRHAHCHLVRFVGFKGWADEGIQHWAIWHQQQQHQQQQLGHATTWLGRFDSVSDHGAPPSGAYDVRWHERVGHYSSTMRRVDIKSASFVCSAPGFSSVSDHGAPPSGAYDVRWHERVGHYSSTMR
ncbi:hypothetical protein CERZMDRAFT_89608 [Cercospora zeae-maydis SCOH1-5]|uniref:Uncharacterized protein n=1 Tax=Cercospora zeae-maydis SCOH1-5 TaxID=717836 RepID=A0A6A6FWE5_9PEZI|nr:hypothetical protein CERZMDRAFT_89608 [Cercospora zeae-maydis SCOH1-5]